MIVNFRVYEINQDIYKLIQISTLIKKKKKEAGQKYPGKKVRFNATSKFNYVNNFICSQPNVKAIFSHEEKKINIV